MNREDLNKLLKAKPLTFTYAEIEQMMDEEMAKDPEEMDTEFVDLCVEVLSKAISEKAEKNAEQKNKRIRLRLTKIFAVAIIIVLSIGFAIPVSAKYVYNDTSDKIVRFYEDHFSINLRNANAGDDIQFDNSADLIAELQESGFDNVILPSALLEDDYTYSVNITEESDTVITALIDFETPNNNSVIRGTITKFKNGLGNLFDNETQMTVEYDSAKQLVLNGIDVFIFGNKKISSITYVDNDIYYDINLENVNFDTAIEIAKSLG